MKILTQWGFTREFWRGQHGEYWVLAQGTLMLGFILLPTWQPIALNLDENQVYLYIKLSLAAAFATIAAVFLIRGVLELGSSLTPLPYPTEDGQLIQSGVYGIVRHPIYSGVIFAALSWVLFQWSLSHFIATVILVLFFDAKANREEVWLTEKYIDYPDYRINVKKLIPWIY